MKNNQIINICIEKLVIIGIAFFLLFSTVALAKQSIKQESVLHSNQIEIFTIIYVDDDAPPEWYDETHVHTIGEAILNASAGDSIFVYSGHYQENLIIDKTLTLTGEDKNTTCIEGSGTSDVVLVTAEGVTIAGFTICNSVDGYGIYVNGGDEITIEDNVITTTATAIYVEVSYGQGFICDNLITGNDDGIYDRGWTQEFLISGNIVTENNGRGISTRGGYKTITDNIVTYNHYEGIFLDSWHNHVEGNTIIGNDRDGIQVGGQDNVIVRNTIHENDGDGIDVFGGWDAHDTIIEENIITNSRYHGIDLDEAHNTVITNNYIAHNPDYGIQIEDGCSGSLVTGNNLSFNYYGIYVETNSNDNTIYHNIFQGNGAYDECLNTWHNGYPSGGNAWDSHPDPEDEFSGPNQDIPGSDGIIDTPYLIPGGNNTDSYPLYLFEDNELNVAILGPDEVIIGDRVEYEREITGGMPPYPYQMWRWGDGSGGTSNGHAYPGNQQTTYNMAFVVQDTADTIGVGIKQITAQLGSDNNIFIDKFIKHDSSSSWGKYLYGRIGDILDVKIVAHTVGSDLLDIHISDQHTHEFAYVNDSLNIDPYFYYPGEGQFGPAFVWLMNNTAPGSIIEITYQVEIIDNVCISPALEGHGFDSVYIIGYYSEEQREGPSDFVATDTDFVLVRIKQPHGMVHFVDDSGWFEFTSIQEAIDAAADGDVIIVFPGLYQESLTIEKSLTITGRNPRTTIIDGDVNLTESSCAVNIFAENVTIQGFTIKNAMKSGIYVDATLTTIQQNRLIDNGQEGIYVHNGDYTLIKGNSIVRCFRGIIIMSDYNHIKGNIIRHNDIGCMIEHENVGTSVTQNIFLNNEYNGLDFNLHANSWYGMSLLTKTYVGNYWDDHSEGALPYVSVNPFYPGLILDLYPLHRAVGEPDQIEEVVTESPHQVNALATTIVS